MDIVVIDVDHFAQTFNCKSLHLLNTDIPLLVLDLLPSIYTRCLDLWVKPGALKGVPTCSKAVPRKKKLVKTTNPIKTISPRLKFLPTGA